MSTTPERWELGSEFHRVSVAARGETEAPSPWELTPVTWTGAGRDGIRLLLEHGVRTRGWRRCWLPSYLCQEVVAAARSTGIDCALYPWNPLMTEGDPGLNLGDGDVLMVVHQFGLSGRPAWLDSIPADVDVVEDHTHDPWSSWARTSRATYAFASLRKTLPLACGTPIWSPTGATLPEQPELTEVRARAASLKGEGMSSKARYLSGEAISKDLFRASLLAGEAEIAAGAISSISPDSVEILSEFPLVSWRETRRANAEHLRALIAGMTGVNMLDWSEGAVPFSAILVLPDRAARDHLRSHLIESSIYPAILWPVAESELDGITELDRSLADRMLSVHCDGRYGRSDMDRVAEALAGGLTP